MQNSSIFGGWAWEETMLKRTRRNRTGTCVAFQKGHVKRDRYRGHAWKALRVPWKTKVSLVAHQQLHTVRLMVLAVSVNFFFFLAFLDAGIILSTLHVWYPLIPTMTLLLSSFYKWGNYRVKIASLQWHLRWKPS